MRPVLPWVAGALALTAACAMSTDEAPTAPAPGVEFSDVELQRILRHSPLPAPPVDTTNAYANDPGAAELGQRLFFDENLSLNGEISCATCHLPDQSWTDGRVLARGVADVHRNTPTLWNVAHNRWFFWDGRADSLWAQSLGPLESPREHGGSRLQFVHYIAAQPDLSAAYERVFGPMPDVSDSKRFPPEGRPASTDVRHPHRAAWTAMRPEDQAAVNEVFVNMGKSLAAYQTLLVSDRSDFDVFVEGLRVGDPARMAVLSESAKRGLKFFVGIGRCHMCHQGPFFSDKEFHDLRLPASAGLPTDHGRALGLKRVQSHPFNGLSEYSDDTEAGKLKVGFLARDKDTGWRQYKTPSLRNVEFTAPYMHQGQFETLREVLEYYSTFEGAADPLHPEMILVPLELSDQEIDDVIAFLRSLSDTAVDPVLLEPPGVSLR